jgi:hypothetical protein
LTDRKGERYEGGFVKDDYVKTSLSSKAAILVVGLPPAQWYPDLDLSMKGCVEESRDID